MNNCSFPALALGRPVECSNGGGSGQGEGDSDIMERVQMAEQELNVLRNEFLPDLVEEFQIVR